MIRHSLILSLACAFVLLAVTTPRAIAQDLEAKTALATARTFVTAKRWADALDAVNRALERSPKWIDALNLRIEIQVEMAGPESTLEDLAKAKPGVDYATMSRALFGAAADLLLLQELQPDPTKTDKIIEAVGNLRARATAAQRLAPKAPEPPKPAPPPPTPAAPAPVTSPAPASSEPSREERLARMRAAEERRAQWARARERRAATSPPRGDAPVAPFKRGDVSISPFMIGPALNFRPYSAKQLGLFSDVDYHLGPRLAVGFLFDMAFLDNLTTLAFGPQLKLKTTLGSAASVPYLRLALPFGVVLPSRGNKVFGIGTIRFGLGYRYFFHPRIGVGAELGFLPWVTLSPVVDFGFAFLMQFGVELRF
jgi:hypothetical protein